jgi:hypothetical protein
LDYENRPDICKQYKCRVFYEQDLEKQKKIIDEIKNEEFIICKK